MANNTHSEEQFIHQVSNKIKRLRISNGYSSYETFAVENGIDRKQYWRVENGQNLTIKTLSRVLDKLGVSPAEFFSDFK